MIIAGLYSFNGGREFIESHHAAELSEIKTIIMSIDGLLVKNKISQERLTLGRTFYSPPGLNDLFKVAFSHYSWISKRVYCDYSADFYTEEYRATTEAKQTRGAFREMDYIKNGLGVEVQFGKYAFMVYNVAAKMTIFRNLGHIRAGVEIVPVKAMAQQMSSGVSYFEQFVWDLEQRGVSNIDVPVLIIGVAV